MIIVSQDKELLVSFDTVWLEDMGEGWFAINIAGKIKDACGIYKTKERAKEVLAEIVDAYHHCLDVYYMPEE